MDLLPMAPASCSLDQDELGTQLARYRAAGDDAQVIHHDSRRLVIGVSDQVSTGSIDELVATERSCCPFFELDWDPEPRRLSIAVTRPEHEPALGAIAHALGLTDGLA